MNAFQVVFVPLLALFAVAALYRAGRGNLSRRQGLFWGLVWGLGALLIALPQTTLMLAAWLGIGRGSDLVFYLAIMGGLVFCLYFHGRFRRLEVMVTELVRHEAVSHPKWGPRPETKDE